MTEYDFSPVCDVYNEPHCVGRRFWDRKEGVLVFRTMREAAVLSQFVCKVCLEYLSEGQRRTAQVYWTPLAR